MASGDEVRAPLLPGWARVGPLCSIPGLLREHRLEPAAVLAQAGVPPNFFDDPDQVVDYREAGLALSGCAAATGCAHFGLLVGQRCSLAGLGLVGRLAGSATDVGTALRAVARYFPLFDRGAVLTVRVTGEECSLVFGILPASMPGADQLYDTAIAIAFNTLRVLCGNIWRPSLVTLPHKAPPDVRPFRTYFGAKIRFDAAEAAIVFERSWLARPVSRSNMAEHLLLLDHAARMEAIIAMKIAERVHRHLRGSLPAHWLSEEQVATQLMMAPRTLRLRLSEEGASFKAVVDELRYETARQFLAGSSLELQNIALLLGYSEANAFSRAFHRWSGMTPSAWPAKHATDGAR